MQGSKRAYASGLMSIVIVLFGINGCEADQNGAVDAATPIASSRQEVAISRPTLLTKTTSAHGGGSSGWNQHIAVPVSIDGGPALAFIVDTGSARTTMFVPSELLALPGVAARFKAGDQTMQGVGGAEVGYRKTVRSFGVGQARVGPFEYVVMADRQYLLSGMNNAFGPVAGILGNDYMAHFRVTIDYRAGKMWLEER